MIAANMHEAKGRLSALVKAVGENDQGVVICRNGKEMAGGLPMNSTCLLDTCALLAIHHGGATFSN